MCGHFTTQSYPPPKKKTPAGSTKRPQRQGKARQGKAVSSLFPVQKRLPRKTSIFPAQHTWHDTPGMGYICAIWIYRLRVRAKPHSASKKTRNDKSKYRIPGTVKEIPGTWYGLRHTINTLQGVRHTAWYGIIRTKLWIRTSSNTVSDASAKFLYAVCRSLSNTLCTTDASKFKATIQHINEQPDTCQQLSTGGEYTTSNSSKAKG